MGGSIKEVIAPKAVYGEAPTGSYATLLRDVYDTLKRTPSPEGKIGAGVEIARTKAIDKVITAYETKIITRNELESLLEEISPERFGRMTYGELNDFLLYWRGRFKPGATAVRTAKPMTESEFNKFFEAGVKPTAVAAIKLYRTTRGFAEDAALRTDLETKQGYELFASFNTPEAMQEAASRLAGQDLKFVKHISTTNVPTWEIYAKPIPKAPVTPGVGKETFVFRGLNFREIKGGIGLQVQVPETQKWVDTAILNRKTLASDYSGVPDLALWKGRVLQGTLNFPSEIAITKAESGLYWYSIYELKQMCQQKGLSTEGSKEDLIRRLKRL